MSKADANWKLKYQELKAKFMSSVDTAFRLGFEQGAQQAQVSAAQDQAAQAQEQTGQQGQSQEGEQTEQAPQEGQEQGQSASAHPGGSELDQHIAELSSMLGKSELTGDDMASLKKSLDSLRASVDLRKSSVLISSIGKSLKGVKIPQTSLTAKNPAKANLTPVSAKAVSMQEQIVRDIMSDWEKESYSVKSEVSDILKKD